MRRRLANHWRDRGIWYVIAYVISCTIIGSALLPDLEGLRDQLLALVLIAGLDIVGGLIVFVTWVSVTALQDRLNH
jgi:hypothetical protein